MKEPESILSKGFRLTWPKGTAVGRGRVSLGVHDIDGKGETEKTEIRTRKTKEAINKAIDDFIKQHNRFPYWDVVQLVVTHVTTEVLVELFEEPLDMINE